MTKQPLWEHLRDQAMQDLKNWKPESEGEVAELVAELRHFVAEYQKMRGLDPENIYSIHQGDAEKEAHLRVSRLSRIAELLERLTHQPEVEEPTDDEIPDNYVGHEKGFAQEHLARLMRDAIGTETNHNAYIVAAGRILDRPEFACVARWGRPTPQPVAEGAPLSLVTNCHTSGPAPKPFASWSDYFNHVQQSGVISGLKIQATLPTPEATDD